MLLRYTSAVLLGTVATFGLLVLMRSVIADPLPAEDAGFKGHIVDWARIVKEHDPIVDPPTPKRPPPPDEPPPPMPTIIGGGGSPIGIWEKPQPPAVGGEDFLNPYLSDGEYLPVVRVSPIYPRRALTRASRGTCWWNSSSRKRERYAIPLCCSPTRRASSSALRSLPC